MIDDPGDAAGSTNPKDLFKSINMAWQALSLAEQDEYALEAVAARQRAILNQSVVQGLLSARLQCMKADRERVRAESGLPNSLGSCRFDDDMLKLIANRVAAEKHSRCFHGDPSRSPKPPTAREQEVLEDIESTLPPQGQPRRASPWWLNCVVLNRDMFHACALGSDSEDDSVLWLFLLGKQSPRYEACFLQLREVPTVIGANYERLLLPDTVRFWKYLDPLVIVAEDKLDLGDDASMVVYTRVHFEGTLAVTYHECVPFEHHTRFFPKNEPRSHEHNQWPEQFPGRG